MAVKGSLFFGLLCLAAAMSGAVGNPLLRNSALACRGDYNGRGGGGMMPGGGGMGGGGMMPGGGGMGGGGMSSGGMGGGGMGTGGMGSGGMDGGGMGLERGFGDALGAASGASGFMQAGRRMMEAGVNGAEAIMEGIGRMGRSVDKKR